MAISYLYTGEPMNGTDADNFVIAFKGSTGTDNNTVNAGEGDDLVIGDSSDTWIPNASYLNGSIDTAFNLETLTSTWTTAENQMFGASAAPHTTVLAEATIGQSEYYRVQIGAGQQITIDIDFASNTAIGTPRDLVVELQDFLGNVIASADDSLVTDGGRGSVASTPGSASSYDPYLSYTVANAGIYYINVRPFGGGPGSTFTENNTFVLNISVTGHAVNASNPVQGTDTLNGGEGDDALFGQGGNDVINGDGGDDMIDAGSGSDIVHGGEGNDTLYGGDGVEENIHGDAGNDQLYSGGEGHYYGDAGNDIVYAGLTAGVNEVLDGGADIDTLDTRTWNGAYTINLALGTSDFGEIFINFENLVTGNGADTITGTTGANVITTNGGVDVVNAGAGNDIVAGGAEGDDLDGGADFDILNYRASSGAVTVDLAGNSVSGGHGEADSIFGFEGVWGSVLSDVLSGTDGDNELRGYEGADTLTGGEGNDVLDGGINDDTMTGGLGDDTYYVDSLSDVVVELAGEGNDTLAVGFSYVLAADSPIENLATLDPAATPAINLTGNALGQTLTGNAGANVLNGLGGADILVGGAGNDTYHVDTAGDQVHESDVPGTDVVYASVDYTLLAGSRVEVLSTASLVATTPLNLTGNDQTQMIHGNAGANTLSAGSGGTDTLFGLAGSDVLNGNKDANTLHGGDDNDTLVAFDGADLLDGGAGNDTMTGGTGDDRYLVDSAGDVVTEVVGEGNDTIAIAFSYALANGSAVENLETIYAAAVTAIDLTGNSGVNTLTGNAGANVLNGLGGADVLIGLGGNDVYHVDAAGDAIEETAGQGTDVVHASVSYVLTVGAEVEFVETSDAGGVAAINLTGNALNQTITGNAGANVLNGFGGNDVLVGLGGNDSYHVDSAGDVIQEAAAAGTDVVYASASYVLTAGAEIETLSTNSLGATTAINLTGNALGQTLYGNAGANVLNGLGGNDLLAGLAGDDTYHVDAAGDLISEGAGGGTDLVYASASYTLAAAAEIETLSTNSLGAATAINLSGNATAQTIVGNAGANTLNGLGGDDVLSGLGDNDTLNGGQGNDTMIGGAGNDVYHVDAVGDVISEAAASGTDVLYASVTYALSAAAEIETVSTNSLAATTAINLTGNGYGQTITGNAGTNVLNGLGGNDVLVGLGGNDTYHVDAAGDTVHEAAAGGTDLVYASVTYTLLAGQEVETLSTSSLGAVTAIDLTGNALGQTITGNAGANVLNGLGGNDVLVGLGGADTFAFTTALGAGNVDVISGFVVADDTIQLENAVFTGLAAGALTAGAFNTGAGATQADDRIVYNSATGALLFDADGTGAGAAVQFATLSTGLALAASDFIVI